MTARVKFELYYKVRYQDFHVEIGDIFAIGTYSRLCGNDRNWTESNDTRCRRA